jgi:L-threonylcarbamoyladenylate synthase
MKYRHYAPKAPVTVVCGDGEKSAAYIRSQLQDGDGVICFEEYAPIFAAYPTRSLGSQADQGEQARRVFHALREFDSLSVNRIFAQCPDATGLGLAVSNRLKKAAGFCIVEV